MEPLDALVSEGLSAYQDGNYPKALTRFEHALRLAPDDHAVREAAAYSANKAGIWERAGHHWLEISKLTPRRTAPVNYYITALLNARHFNEARAYCEAAEFLQQKPNRPRYYAVRLMISLGEGKLDEARTLATKGYALSPRDAIALDYATHFFDHKLYADMEAWIARIKTPKPHKEAIEILQARAHFAQKIWSKAKPAWQNLLKKSETARLFLARIAANTGKQAEAKKHFDLILQKQPNHQEAIAFLIRAQLLSNNETAARALIAQHGEALDPIRRVQFMARSFAASNPQAGVQVYLDALKTQPENFALKLAHIGFLLDLKNFEEAEEKIRPLLQAQPKHIELNQLFFAAFANQARPKMRQ